MIDAEDLLPRVIDFIESVGHDSWRCTYAQPDGTLIYGCVCDRDKILIELRAGGLQPRDAVA